MTKSGQLTIPSVISKVLFTAQTMPLSCAFMKIPRLSSKLNRDKSPAGNSINILNACRQHGQNLFCVTYKCTTTTTTTFRFSCFQELSEIREYVWRKSIQAVYRIPIRKSCNKFYFTLLVVRIWWVGCMQGVVVTSRGVII